MNTMPPLGLTAFERSGAFLLVRCSGRPRPHDSARVYEAPDDFLSWPTTLDRLRRFDAFPLDHPVSAAELPDELVTRLRSVGWL